MSKFTEAVKKRISDIECQYLNKNDFFKENYTIESWQLMHLRKFLDLQETIRNAYLQYLIPYEKYQKYYDWITDAMVKIMQSEPTETNPNN